MTAFSTSANAISRRRFIGAAGATAAGAAVLGSAACSGGSKTSSDRPNVLLVILDSVRSDYVSAYGAPRVRTPNIDSLAAQGTRFTRFFPEAMPTVPARRTIMSGKRVFPFRGWERTPDLGRGPGAAPIDDLHGIFTSRLQREGYWTASASDNPFLGFTRTFRPFRLTFDRFVSVVGHSGLRNDPATVSDALLDKWMPDGLRDDRYIDGLRRYLANTGYGRDDSESSAARVFKEGTKLMEEAADHQPFALMVDCFDPHEPWSPAAEFIRMYSDPSYHGANPGTARYARADSYLETDELRQMTAVYAAALTIADKWLGEFLGRFRELGLHENTVIAFLSDHGILLGDRGWTGKVAGQLHPELMQVPCILIHPEGKGAGATTPYFASTQDIAPTLLSMAGIDVPRDMDGVDLSLLFDGEELPERPYANGGYFNHFYLRSDEWGYVCENRGHEFELYDLALDPGELTDVASENRDAREELHARALEIMHGLPPYYSGKAVEPIKR